MVEYGIIKNGGVRMTIAVKPDGKKFKIMVDCIKRGISLTSAALANKEAEKIRAKEAPTADLVLVEA